MYKRKTRPLSSIYAFYRPFWKTDSKTISTSADTQKITKPQQTVQITGGGYTWGLAEYDGVMGWIALDYTQQVGKSVDELAREVIAGKWGNGDARKKALGSLYKAVQKRVNEMMK